jgi:hypothetical protein
MTAHTSFGARLPAPRAPAREVSLAWRVVLLNSAVMLAASLALALGPATVSTPVRTRELLVLLAGVGVTMGANVVLVRRAFAPLGRLTRLMRRVDPLAPGTRLEMVGAAREVRELADAFVRARGAPSTTCGASRATCGPTCWSNLGCPARSTR